MKNAFRSLASGAVVAALFIPVSVAAAQSSAPVIPARPKPMHIMSINMCTDIYLLQMVPKERIASITYLAHKAVKFVQPGLDADILINHGAAEEIVREKPDIILASDFSTPMARKLAKQMHIPMIETKSAARTWDDIRATTRQIGAAIGEPEKAEAMVARMDKVLADLAAEKPIKPYVVAAWEGDTVPGKKTLSNTIIETAGAINIASKGNNDRSASFGIEQLLKAQPDILMYGADTLEKPSLKNAGITHPVVQKAWAGRQVTYPGAFYTCGAPQSADAARDLHDALAAIAGKTR